MQQGIPFFVRKVASDNNDEFELYKIHFGISQPVKHKQMKFQTQKDQQHALP